MSEPSKERELSPKAYFREGAVEGIGLLIVFFIIVQYFYRVQYPYNVGIFPAILADLLVYAWLAERRRKALRVWIDRHEKQSTEITREQTSL